MKHPEKPATSSSPKSQQVTDDTPKHSAKMPPARLTTVVKRSTVPALILGGSSGDTDAGTGLGLGNDASDTAGGRRLPGRRPDNKLTIPRCGGPGPDSTIKPAKKPSGGKT